MRKQVLVSVYFLLALGFKSLDAQEEQKINDMDLDFYGFVRSDFFYDSYKGIDAFQEVFYLFPRYNGQDADGEDINKQGSANLQAIASRMGVNVTGPEIFGAKSVSNIEFDFGGIVTSEPTLFRIRRAYTSLQWENSSLLVGQNWHPFWTGSIYPTVGGFNTGAPFQPFNRSPQLRFDYQWNNLMLTGAAVYQLQYTSPAAHSTQSTSGQAKRNAVLPEFIGNIQYSGESFNIGAGISHNLTKPKMLVKDTANNEYKADEFLTSMSYLGYAQYKSSQLKILAKSVYGQNMKHFLIPGGFGIKSYDMANGQETYTNYNTLSSYLNLVYGNRLQYGIYGGYIKNLGTVDELIDPVNSNFQEGITYGFFQNIQSIYRVAGHLALNVNNFRFVAEYELTAASYGTGRISFTDGLYQDAHLTRNNRILLMMMYTF